MFIEEFQEKIGMPRWAEVDENYTFAYDLTGLRYIVSTEEEFWGLNTISEHNNSFLPTFTGWQIKNALRAFFICAIF